MLEFDPADRKLVVAALRRFVRGVPNGKEAHYAAVGVDWEDSRGDSFDAFSDFDELDVVVYRNLTPPSWAIKESTFTDVRHLVNVALFRGSFVAVHLAQPWRQGIQAWLNQAPRPPLRRISAGVLEYA